MRDDRSKKSINKKGKKLIETNTYIITFDSPDIQEKIEVDNNMEKEEQFVLNPLRFYKCQKHGSHENNCGEWEVCGKCGQQEPENHTN